MTAASTAAETLDSDARRSDAPDDERDDERGRDAEDDAVDGLALLGVARARLRWVGRRSGSVSLRWLVK